MKIKGINFILVGLTSSVLAQSNILINEIVVDPKQDHNGDGKITDSDEYFEIYNSSTNFYNLKNWKLELIDTTPETFVFPDISLGPGKLLVIRNPRGAQNNNGEIRLINAEGELEDIISYGSWTNSFLPDGRSTNINNEALFRYPDGSTNWIKGYATRGLPNSLTPYSNDLRLEIKKEDNGIEVICEEFLPYKKEYILQSTENIGTNIVWKNIYTNFLPMRYIDQEKKEKKMYRVKEK